MEVAVAEFAREYLKRHILRVWVSIIALAMLVVIWIDDYAYNVNGWTLTMSWQLKYLAHEHPIVPFVLGVAVGGIVFGLAAHIFTTMPRVETWEEFTRLRLDSILMKQDALKWYNADGSYTMLSSPEEVTRRRIEAAGRLEKT